MLSISQVYAILALLLAFNVPVDTVNTVKGILAPSTPAVVVAPPSLEIGGVGAPEVPRVTSCDPILKIWAVNIVAQRNPVIDQVWVYSPCKGIQWYLDTVGGEEGRSFSYNGEPTSGPFKGLSSYVVKNVNLADSSGIFTVKIYSPDTPETISTTTTYEH